MIISSEADGDLDLITQAMPSASPSEISTHGGGGGGGGGSGIGKIGMMADILRLSLGFNSAVYVEWIIWIANQRVRLVDYVII